MGLEGRPGATESRLLFLPSWLGDRVPFSSLQAEDVALHVADGVDVVDEEDDVGGEVRPEGRGQVRDGPREPRKEVVVLDDTGVPQEGEDGPSPQKVSSVS